LIAEKVFQKIGRHIQDNTHLVLLLFDPFSFKALLGITIGLFDP
jgi:hypothetical protein